MGSLRVPFFLWQPAWILNVGRMIWAVYMAASGLCRQSVQLGVAHALHAGQATHAGRAMLLGVCRCLDVSCAEGSLQLKQPVDGGATFALCMCADSGECGFSAEEPVVVCNSGYVLKVSNLVRRLTRWHLVAPRCTTLQQRVRLWHACREC